MGLVHVCNVEASLRREGCGVTAATESAAPSIGFVALYALPLFDERVGGSIGGMETRCAILSRGMASRGWNVSVFVQSCGKLREACFGGVFLRRYDPFWLQMEPEMRARFSKRWWFPIVNGTRNEISLLWRVPLYLLFRPFPHLFGSHFWGKWKELGAVLCFGNNDVSARTIADCRRYGIPSMLMIASDSDLDEDYAETARGFNRYGASQSGCWYALTHANAVVVQTELQQKFLAERFGREGVLLRNPLPLPPPGMRFDCLDRNTALWIGRTDNHHKRPKLCLDLARQLPEIQFTMVVNAPSPRQFRELEQIAPANVRLIERVEPSRMWELLANSRLFVSTSSSAFEGFPNVFLQAAVARVPVVSLEVDPDGLFSKIGGGFCARGDFAEFVTTVKKVWADKEFGDAASAKLADYVEKRHSLRSSLDHLVDAISAIRPHAGDAGQG